MFCHKFPNHKRQEPVFRSWAGSTMITHPQILLSHWLIKLERGRHYATLTEKLQTSHQNTESSSRYTFSILSLSKRFNGTPTGSRTTIPQTTIPRTTNPRTTDARTTYPRMRHILECDIISNDIS